MNNRKKTRFVPCVGGMTGFLLEPRVVLNSTVVTTGSDGSTTTTEYDDDNNMIDYDTVSPNGDETWGDAQGDYSTTFANGDDEVYDAGSMYGYHSYADGTKYEWWDATGETLMSRGFGDFTYTRAAHDEVDEFGTTHYGDETVERVTSPDGTVTTTVTLTANGDCADRKLIVRPDSTLSLQYCGGDHPTDMNETFNTTTEHVNYDTNTAAVTQVDGDPVLAPALPPTPIGPAGPA